MNQSKEPMNKKHARKKQSMYTHHIGFASADSSLLNASQGVKYVGPLNIGSRIYTSTENRRVYIFQTIEVGYDTSLF